MRRKKHKVSTHINAYHLVKTHSKKTVAIKTIRLNLQSRLPDPKSKNTLRLDSTQPQPWSDQDWLTKTANLIPLALHK